jgi:hypothetical protein
MKGKKQMNKKTKTFDCVEMKRLIQEKIYEETKNMSREEYLTFIRKQVDESPFGKLLKQYDIKNKYRYSEKEI